MLTYWFGDGRICLDQDHVVRWDVVRPRHFYGAVGHQKSCPTSLDDEVPAPVDDEIEDAVGLGERFAKFGMVENRYLDAAQWQTLFAKHPPAHARGALSSDGGRADPRL